MSVDNPKGALLELVAKSGQGKMRVKFDSPVVVNSLFLSRARLSVYSKEVGVGEDHGALGGEQGGSRTGAGGSEAGWQEVAVEEGCSSSKKAAEKEAATKLLQRLQDGGDLEWRVQVQEADADADASQSTPAATGERAARGGARAVGGREGGMGGCMCAGEQ